MKPAFIKYKNLGRELTGINFDIYSDSGRAIPGELSSENLLQGSVVQIDANASKVFVVPQYFDLIASGFNGLNLSEIFTGNNIVEQTPSVVRVSNLDSYENGDDYWGIANFNGTYVKVEDFAKSGNDYYVGRPTRIEWKNVYIKSGSTVNSPEILAYKDIYTGSPGVKLPWTLGWELGRYGIDPRFYTNASGRISTSWVDVNKRNFYLTPSTLYTYLSSVGPGYTPPGVRLLSTTMPSTGLGHPNIRSGIWNAATTSTGIFVWLGSGSGYERILGTGTNTVLGTRFTEQLRRYNEGINVFNINPTNNNIVETAPGQPINIIVSGSWCCASAEWLSSTNGVNWHNFTLTNIGGYVDGTLYNNHNNPTGHPNGFYVTPASGGAQGDGTSFAGTYLLSGTLNGKVRYVHTSGLFAIQYGDVYPTTRPPGFNPSDLWFIGSNGGGDNYYSIPGSLTPNEFSTIGRWSPSNTSGWAASGPGGASGPAPNFTPFYNWTRSVESSANGDRFFYSGFLPSIFGSPARYLKVVDTAGSNIGGNLNISIRYTPVDLDFLKLQIPYVPFWLNTGVPITDINNYDWASDFDHDPADGPRFAFEYTNPRTVSPINKLRFIKAEDTPVFIPGSNNYSLTQRLTGSNSSNYEFGTDSLKISSLGNTLTVSSTKSFSTPETALFIFTGVSGSGWALRQSIPHPSGLTSNPAGYSSDLTQNGNVICTTSWGINGSPGYAFIYTGNATNGWTLRQTITGISGNCGFGLQISTNNLGNIIAVTENNNDNASLNKIYVYTGSSAQGVWGLKTTLTHPDLNALGPIDLQQNNFGNILVAGVPNRSGALIFRGTPSTGWGFLTKLSANNFDGSSVSINNVGNVIVLGNPFGPVGGYVNIYTGSSFTNWQFKQQLQISAGFNVDSKFGQSVSIKDTTIVVGAPGNVTFGGDEVGSIYIYTGSATGTWSLSRSFTGTSSPSTELGRQVDIYKDTVVASAPKLSGFGAINIYNPTSSTNVETYKSKNNEFVIWKNPVINYWILSEPELVGENLTAPTQCFFNPVGGYVEGTYTGFNIGGYTPGVSVTVSKINNKLHVYNTPGMSGFAGTYTSGVFTIGGVQRVGFQNDQNSRFYIIKNNLPSVWRAVEWPLGYIPASMTWYSRTGTQGVEEDPGEYPPTYGWQLGDNTVGAPIVVGSNALPLPEMNFGHCAGNTLTYPNYVYQIDSSDSNIDNIKLYSGGVLSSSGTSDLFPGNISNMFPNLINVYFDKQFFYTNFVNNNRYLLFRSLDKGQLNNFYITNPSQNYNSGYYYWVGTTDYLPNSGENTFQRARKVYVPVGNNINGLRNISINMNPLYINQKFGEENDLSLGSLTSGEEIYIDIDTNISGFNIDNIYKYTVLNSLPQSQNTGIFHCLSGENYIFASPRFNVSGARCWNTGVNVWSILNSEYKYTGIQNCATGTGVLPSKLWFTGAWSSFTNKYSNLRFTRLYPYNQTVQNLSFSEQNYLLSINTGYNFNLVSGVTNLNTGQQFIFNFDGISFTGVAVRKTNGNILGSINGLNPEYAYFYYNTGQNGVQFINIKLLNRDIEYGIRKSGSNTVFKKTSISKSRILCGPNLN
jgi:hypothetical protein